MNIYSFVEVNNLKAGDAVMLSKKMFGLFDHYVIYLGAPKGKPEFIANYDKGVKIVPEHDIVKFLTILEPKSIERMNGDVFERRMAVERAKARLGEMAYSLVSNNCEHFKNWVQKGIEYSLQAENFGNISLIGGFGLTAVGLANKNKTLTILGLLAMFAGAVSKANQKDDRKA